MANDTLCHGRSGNAELFLRFAMEKDEPAFQLEANMQAQVSWRRLATTPGWLGTDGDQQASPGLMIGIAGLGVHFLRLAYPDRVPSPLLLDPPQPQSPKIKKRYRNMSTESCTAFLGLTQRDPYLQRQLRIGTGIRELVVLGRKHGYSFGIDNVMASSSAFPTSETTPQTAVRAPEAQTRIAETTICHYEFDLCDLPEFGPVLAELPNLTIKPPTVDLDLFRASFRREDLEWTSMSPAAPGFQRHYQDVIAPHWTGQENDRRDFHPVSLGEHVDPLYDQYFEAKTRTITHLDQIFGSEIQFSGSMWYPPFAYRLWHTNETQPGWECISSTSTRKSRPRIRDPSSVT